MKIYHVKRYKFGKSDAEWKFRDEDEMRMEVDLCLDELETEQISAFVVSKKEDSPKDIPFWEKEDKK